MDGYTIALTFDGFVWCSVAVKTLLGGGCKQSILLTASDIQLAMPLMYQQDIFI